VDAVVNSSSPDARETSGHHEKSFIDAGIAIDAESEKSNGVSRLFLRNGLRMMPDSQLPSLDSLCL
jgi:hypothetical protein